MTGENLLRTFDRRLRRDALADSPASTVERTARVTRQVDLSGGWNGILWSGLDAASADAAIAGEVAYFTSLGVPGFEWKHYSYDEPADLADRLLAAGFVPEDPETVLVAGVAELAGMTAPLPEGVEIRPVLTPADADLVAEVHDAAFGGGGDRIRRRVLARLAADPETVWTWLAMAGERPVCAARMELHEGTSFASLWGGGTVEEWRGKGIYKALVAYRARLAAELGCEWVQVDASDQSRPILERVGFVALGVTTPFVYGD